MSGYVPEQASLPLTVMPIPFRAQASAPVCLSEFTDFEFSAEALVSKNLAAGKKEMRFQAVGVDSGGQPFDLVVRELTKVL